jgi:hypothetical protein
VVRLRPKQKPAILRWIAQRHRIFSAEICGNREPESLVLWLQADRRRTGLRRNPQQALNILILNGSQIFRRVSRIAPVVVLGLLVAGCGLFDKDIVYRCPEVFILEDAKDLTKFKPGSGRDITDILFEAEIVNFTGGCEYDKGEAEIELLVQIRVERGPANRNRGISFEYFVAIPKFQSQPEGKRVLPVKGAFEDNKTRLIYQDELTMTIPVKAPTDGAGIEIVLGFQLTPDQLKFNRSRKQR